MSGRGGGAAGSSPDSLTVMPSPPTSFAHFSSLAHKRHTPLLPISPSPRSSRPKKEKTAVAKKRRRDDCLMPPSFRLHSSLPFPPPLLFLLCPKEPLIDAPLPPLFFLHRRVCCLFLLLLLSFLSPFYLPPVKKRERGRLFFVGLHLSLRGGLVAAVAFLFSIARSPLTLAWTQTLCGGVGAQIDVPDTAAGGRTEKKKGGGFDNSLKVSHPNCGKKWDIW